MQLSVAEKKNVSIVALGVESKPLYSWRSVIKMIPRPSKVFEGFRPLKSASSGSLS